MAVHISLIAAIVAMCGAAGGFVTALLTGNLLLPRRGSPGWIGDVTIGAIAAFVLWSLFDPSSAAAAIGEAGVHANGTLSIGNVVASLVVGIGGARIFARGTGDKRLTT
jgi:hypothetical protein